MGHSFLLDDRAGQAEEVKGNRHSAWEAAGEDGSRDLPAVRLSRIEELQTEKQQSIKGG